MTSADHCLACLHHRALHAPVGSEAKRGARCRTCQCPGLDLGESVKSDLVRACEARGVTFEHRTLLDPHQLHLVASWTDANGKQCAIAAQPGQWEHLAKQVLSALEQQDNGADERAEGGGA